MKSIGMLFGIDTNFPLDVIAYINSKNFAEVHAEEIKIDIIKAHDKCGYSVVFDRISEFVPFYKSYLRSAKRSGTIVVSNCFSSCHDDDFNHLSLASSLGILTPKSALIPSKWLPTNTSPEAMRNLQYPLNWSDMFDYVGFPAFLKSNSASGALHDFKVYNKFEFYSAYELTGSNTMLLQEAVEYDNYYRCFVIGKKYVKIAHYNPAKPLHLRYSPDEPQLDKSTEEELIKISKLISSQLDYNFNAVEFAVKGNKIYAVEFRSSMPTIERHILFDNNYDWLVKMMSEYLIEACR